MYIYHSPTEMYLAIGSGEDKLARRTGVCLDFFGLDGVIGHTNRIFGCPYEAFKMRRCVTHPCKSIPRRRDEFTMGND